MSEKEGFFSYYKWDKAVDDWKWDILGGGLGGKIAGTAKLLGKTAFNVGLFSGETALKIVQELPSAVLAKAEAVASHPDSTPDQKAHATQVADNIRARQESVNRE